MTLLTLIRNIYDATQAGKELTDASTWANRATMSANLAMFATAVLPVLQFLGLQIDVESSDIQAFSTTASVLLIWAADRLHTASNRNAGKTGSNKPDPL